VGEASSTRGPVDAVIFDLFHTLIDPQDAPSWTSTSKILGIRPDVWAKKVIEESPHHALGTVTDPIESIRIIAHSIDPTIPMERIRMAAAARPYRFRAALIHVRPYVLESLQKLRGLGMKLGLISNAGLDEIEAWPDSPLAPLFDAALFSCHEGLMKPNPAIYLRAADRLGVEPANCIFVGDGGSREHEGARAAGMRTVLFLGMLEESYPQTAAARARDTTWVVHSFEELISLLSGLRTGRDRP